VHVAIRPESGRSRETVGKFLDVTLHSGMPEGFEMELVHFADRLLRTPLLECDAIRGKKHSCAISTEAAVNENGILRMRGHQREELPHLLVARWRSTVAGNEHEFYAKRFRFFFSWALSRRNSPRRSTIMVMPRFCKLRTLFRLVANHDRDGR